MSPLRAGLIWLMSLVVACLLGVSCMRSAVDALHPSSSDQQVGAVLATLALGVAVSAWTRWLVALGRVWTHCQRTPHRPVPAADSTPWLRAAALALGVTGLGLTSGAAATATTAGADDSCGVVQRFDTQRFDTHSLDGLPLPTLPTGTQRRRVHVVRPRDSLWEIAGTRWQRLYAANRDAIGPDPDLIVPGQRLTLPHQPLQHRRERP